MKFIDEAKISVRAGDGGRGCLSFRREKFIEFGGPNGGDGGKGGDVVAVAELALNTLVDYRYQPHLRAKNGRPGEGQNRTGADGAGIVLRVPVGTQIFDADGETLIADLTRPGQQVLLAAGGRGGFGNTRFKSSTNRTPRRADKGTPGEERELMLRLKLVADAGLVGLPNAGKSTFLAAVSRARPKIADYPFTTLVPQLGVVRVDEADFVLADIPGLIEGAHEGSGLGDRFLGHIERCGVLLHLVDGTQENVAAAYRTIRKELAGYGGGLAEKPEIVALNKADALSPAEIAKRKAALRRAAGKPVHTISGVTKAGVEDVLRALLVHVETQRTARAQERAHADEVAQWR